MSTRLARTTASPLSLALIAALAGSCATNPATGERQLSFIGEEGEISMGKEADKEISAQLGLYPDDDLQRYVQDLGKKLAATSERTDLPWTFRVVDDPMVNAFALPGGFIYVTRGLMTHLRSEDELAGVLGHEIGHVTARHTVNRISKAQLAQLGLGIGMIVKPELQSYAQLASAGLQLLFLKYSRDDERQADDLGLRYMTRGHYSPNDMIEVFEVLGRVSQLQGGERGRIPTFLMTHPAPEDRTERMAAKVRELDGQLAKRDARGTRDAYLRRTDGMTFGEDPRQGFFEGSAFYHPELAFKVTFPNGWQTANQRQAVIAVPPGGGAVVLVTIANEKTLEGAAREVLGQKGVEPGPAAQSKVNGSDALAMPFRATGEGGVPLRGHAMFINHKGKVFDIIGYGPEQRWANFGEAIRRTMESFEQVTDPEVLGVQPHKLQAVRLERAMTFEEFTQRYPSPIPPQHLALINGIEKTNEQIPAGTMMRRVSGGKLRGKTEPVANR